MSDTPAPGNPTPVFAVVGHPNKGKSSIVATLAADDSVGIAPESGTTTRARKFPLRVDDEVLYVLVDTPGFQRARRALAWMKEHETTAAKHPEVVRRFVEAHQGTGEFNDERELLAAILDDAGILYVVDGSHPYGPEYEAEMEILRWTGRPSMALINPIGRADHVAEWEAALSQYFRVVRVFNAVTAEFEKRIDLLRAFGEIQEAWRQPLQRAVETLEADRARRRRRAARAISEMLAAMVTLSVHKRLAADEDPDRYRSELEMKYRDRLREIEQAERKNVEEIYQHFALKRREDELPPELAEEDLFSERAWEIFGLKKRDFVAMGATGGAAAGVAFDLAAGGFTLGAATILGGVGGMIGGVAGYFSAQRLSQVKVLNLSAGRKELRCGPSKSLNLPFVALGRARLHHARVAGRTHAQRSELVLSGSVGPDTLSSDPRRLLQKIFDRLRRDPDDADTVAEATDDLTDLVEELLESDA